MQFSNKGVQSTLIAIPVTYNFKHQQRPIQPLPLLFLVPSSPFLPLIRFISFPAAPSFLPLPGFLSSMKGNHMGRVGMRQGGSRKDIGIRAGTVHKRIIKLQINRLAVRCLNRRGASLCVCFIYFFIECVYFCSYTQYCIHFPLLTSNFHQIIGSWIS